MSKRSSRPVWLGKDDRGWDHARIHKQILTDPALDQGSRRSNVIAVYVGLAIHAETQTGDTRPAQSTLARYAGCSVRTVARCLEVLTEARYLSVEDRPGMASLYRLLAPPTLDTSAEVAGPDLRTGDEGTYASVSGTPDTSADELEEQLEPKNETAPATPSMAILARALVQSFWDYCTANFIPTPTLPTNGAGSPFLALSKIVERLLDAGWDTKLIKRALIATPTYTLNAITLQLNQAQAAAKREPAGDDWEAPWPQRI